MTCGALSGSNSNEFSISVDGSALNKDFVLGYVYGGQLEEPGFIAAAPTVDMERWSRNQRGGLEENWITGRRTV
jgi:hypothetical protein